MKFIDRRINLTITLAFYLFTAASCLHILKSDVFMEIDAVKNYGVLEDIVEYKLDDADFLSKDDFDKTMNETLLIQYLENEESRQGIKPATNSHEDKPHNGTISNHTTHLNHTKRANRTNSDNKLKKKNASSSVLLQIQDFTTDLLLAVKENDDPELHTAMEELELKINPKPHFNHTNDEDRDPDHYKYVIIDKSIPNLSKQYSNFSVFSPSNHKIVFHIEEEPLSTFTHIVTFLRLRKGNLKRKKNKVKVIYRYHVNDVFSPEILEKSIKFGEHAKIVSSIEQSNIDTSDDVQSNFNIFISNLRYNLGENDFESPVPSYEVGYYTNYKMRFFNDEMSNVNTNEIKKLESETSKNLRETELVNRIYRFNFKATVTRSSIRFIQFKIHTPGIENLKENGNESSQVYENILLRLSSETGEEFTPRGSKGGSSITRPSTSSFGSKGGSSIARPSPSSSSSFGSKGGSSIARPSPPISSSFGSKGGSSIARPSPPISSSFGSKGGSSIARPNPPISSSFGSKGGSSIARPNPSSNSSYGGSINTTPSSSSYGSNSGSSYGSTYGSQTTYTSRPTSTTGYSSYSTSGSKSSSTTFTYNHYPTPSPYSTTTTTTITTSTPTIPRPTVGYTSKTTSYYNSYPPTSGTSYTVVTYKSRPATAVDYIIGTFILFVVIVIILCIIR